MNNAGAVLALARRIVAAVSALSMGACCRETGRFDASFAVSSTTLGARVVDGAVDDASCVAACKWNVGGRCETVEVHSCSATTVDGGPGIYCNTTNFDCPGPIGAACGRRTDGVACDRTTDTLSALVALESEAIAAFERLARELAALGAPEALVCDARSCAQDERRHVSMVSALADRAGVGEPDSRGLPLRSPFEIALENAVEGCVREVYGVLVAQWQSEHSEDARVRECYAQIAIDEAKHGAFALSVGAWLDEKLTSDERAQLAVAKRDAVAELRAQQRTAHADPWLGLPDASTARSLVDALAPSLL